MHLVHWAFLGDEDARAGCLRSFQLADVALSHERNQARPPTIEYSMKEVESQTHLKVFAKHSQEYIMVRHGQWEVCMHTSKQSVLPSQLPADPHARDLLGVPVTQPMVDLLCAILAHTNNLKGSTVNQVVQMWPAHFEQFGKFQTAMGEADREVLHITDVKAVQAKINANSKEKALQAAAKDKVLQG